MRARILLRVSTDQQAKAGTIAAQRGPVRDFARRMGATEIIEYVEEGVSGAAALGDRDVLRRLLADLRPGDLVCLFAQDRLSRASRASERLAPMEDILEAGARLATVEDGEIDLESVAGEITASIRGALAKEERRKIAARTAAGKANAAAEGRKPQGKTPYGLTYDKERRAWGLDEERAPVVRQLFARLLEGDTCSQVAGLFTAAGYPTPRGRSPTWTARMVWQLATRATYRGEWSFDGRTIAVPAIVDTSVWQAVQAQLLAAGRRGLRRTQHVYLLDEGTGRCDACGGPVHVRWGGQRSDVTYYVCPRRACALRWRRTADADAEVWRRILDALRRPDLVERALEGQREADGDARAGEGDAADFDRRLERLAKVEEAILSRFRRGAISEPAFDRELETIGQERRLLEQSAAAAREAAARARASAGVLRGLREAVARVAEELEGADAGERRRVVQALRPDVRLDGDGIRIAFRVRMPGPSTVRPPIAIVSAPCSCTENHCETEPTDGGTVEIAVVA